MKLSMFEVWCVFMFGVIAGIAGMIFGLWQGGLIK